MSDLDPDVLKSIYGDAPTMANPLPTARKLNPQDVAKGVAISKKTGVDAILAAQNLPQFQSELDQDYWNKLVTEHPPAAKFMADPVNAAIMQKDADSGALTAIAEAAKWLTSHPDSKNTLGGLLQWGMHGSSAFLYGGMRAGAELVAPALDPAAGTLLPENPLRRVAAGLAEQSRQQFAAAEKADPQASGFWGQAVQSGGRSLVQNSKYMPLAALGPVGGAAALGGMVFESFGQAYQQAREKGSEMPQAMQFASSQAAIEYATEKLPMKWLVGDLQKGTGFFKMLGKQALAEIPGEQVATALQDMNEWAILHPEKTFKDYLADRPDAAAQTLIATVIGTGGNVTVTHAIDKVLNDGERRVQQAQDANQTAELLQSMQQTMAASEALKTNPETLQTFAQSLVEGGSENVYIEAQRLVDAGIDAKELIDKLPSVAAQLDTITEGGDIVVPIGELLTNSIGTTFAQTVIDHARTAPDAMSRVEAQEYMQEQGTKVQDEVQRVLQEREADTVFQQERDGLQKEITDQLNTMGRFKSDVNEKYAALTANFYAVMAARANMGLQEFVNTYRLGFASQEAKGKRTMDQYGQDGQLVTDSENFRNWFKESKAVDSTGAPIQVYHGTNQSFDTFDAERGGSNAGNAAGKQGFYFIDRPDIAGRYATMKDGDANVMPVYLSIQNPTRASFTNMMEADKFLAQGYEGDGAIIDITTPSGAKSTVYAIKDPNQVKSVFNNGEFSTTDNNILHQGNPADLVAQHNLTADNLLHAVKMGGLPVPSLAVTKKDHPLTGFGEITLLAPSEMVDPKGYAATKVFGADIYSPRYPKISLQFTPNMQKRGQSMLKAGMEATGTTYIDWSAVERDGSRELERLPAVMWQFLKEKGVEPPVVRTEPKPLPGLIQQFADDTRPMYELVDDPAFQTAAWETYYQNILKAYDGNEAEARADVEQTKKNAAERGTSHLVNGYARDVQQYQRDKRESGKVDRSQTQWQMEKLVREQNLQGELADYAKGIVAELAPNERIFQGFNNSGNRKYTPHTLENVVKLLKKELRGGENFNYGVGSLRAKFTPQFKTLEQIRKAKGRLMDKAAFEAVKKEVDDELVAISERLDLSLEQTIEVLEDAPKMGVTRSIERAMKDYKRGEMAGINDEVKTRVAEYLTRLRNLPTEYFEAKILRDVSLSEFKGAVVPEGVNPKVIQALQERGVTDIRTYKKNDDADRAAKIGEFGNLFFQQARGQISFGDDITQQPSFISLLQNADLSTFIHESGHFFLEVQADLATRIYQRMSWGDNVTDGERSIVDDFTKTLTWFGLQPTAEMSLLDQWAMMSIEEKRPYHEQFARGFEAYAFEGRAPSLELQSVFQTFRAWLMNVYKAIKKMVNQATTGKTFNQSEAVPQEKTDTPEFKNWFGDSKVVDTEGKPLVVYHGTTETRSTPGKVKKGDTKARKQLETMAAETGISDWTSVPSVFERLMESGRGAEFGVTAERAAKARELYEAAKGSAESPTTDLAFDVFNMPDSGKELGAHFGTKAQASSFGSVFDFYLAINNPLRLPDLGTWDYQSVMREARKRGVEIYPDEYDAVFNASDNNAALRKLLMSKGYDGVVYANEAEGKGDSYIAFRPEQIKSATGNNGNYDPNDPNILHQSDKQIGEKLDVQLSDEVRGVMDRMLATSEAIAEAEAARSMGPLFKTPEQGGMDMEAFTAYHNEGVKATAAAIDNLQAKGLRDMQWLQNARSRKLKELQKQHAALRDQITIEVRAEVMAKPVYRAWTFLTARDGELVAGEKRKGNSVGLNPDKDNLFTAIAKLGGLDRAAVKAAWGIDEKERMDSGVFGAPVVRKTNGLSLDAMAERLVENGYMLPDENGKADMDKFEALFDDQRRGIDRYSIQRDMEAAYGEQEQKPFDLPPVARGKLQTEELRERYGTKETAIWRRLSDLRMTSDEVGLPADVVAEAHGFASGDALVRALAEAAPPKEVIANMVDMRMLSEHGELATPDAIERAADAAIHNEARARFVATELRALEHAVSVRKSVPGQRATVDVLTQVANEQAQSIISKLKVREIRPNQYAAAAARAGRLAEKNISDLEVAAQHKRNQLINTQAAKVAIQAVEEIRSADMFFKRIVTLADKRVGQTRDMDVVNAARAVLASFGYAGKAQAAVKYLETLERSDPELFGIVKQSVESAQAVAKPFKDLTYEEVKGLRAEIDALWHLAGRSKQMEVDGNLLDREELAMELNDRMVEIGVPEAMPGDTSAITPKEQSANDMRGLAAALRRVESWAELKDGGKLGVFKKYVFLPIKAAADKYRAKKVVALRDYRSLFDSIAPTMKRETIHAPELGYTFGKDTGGVAMNEILHAILHTGNESNKRKLLLGRGWGTVMENGEVDTRRWDSFIYRLIREGKLTKEHFDFAQGVWDSMESLKPDAQKAHRDAYGKYFEEVTADGFQMPWGSYRGGYVPAMADSRIVKDQELKRLVEEGKEGMQFAFPSTSKGFTKSRVEYNRPLLLDLRTLPQHIDKVLLFSHMENPVRDVSKLIGMKEVSEPLYRLDPAAINSMLMPWLNRAARQQVTTPVQGAGAAMRWANTLRNRTSMATMFANVSNTAQQITGFALAGVKVKPKYLVSAMAQYAKAPKKMAANVAELSPYMANRMSNEVGAMMGEMDAILLDPNLYEKTVEWTKRHTYFMQLAVDNVMGPIIWHGAFNEALEEGYSDDDAARIADSAVRQTQGSTLPEDVSRAETGNAFVRLFSQFYGYFNMQANLLGTEFGKVAQETGLRKKMGRGFYVTMMAFYVPAMLAEAIAQMFRGGPGDEDKDGEWLDDWLMALFVYGPARNLTAFVPFVGQAVNSAVARFNGNPVDDKMSVSPVVGAIEGGAGVPYDLYKMAIGEGNAQRTVKDLATLISITTGLPASVAARPLSWLAGVAQDKVEPTGPVDAARGLVTGVASKESKQ